MDTIKALNVSYQFVYSLEGTGFEELVKGDSPEKNSLTTTQVEIKSGYKVNAMYEKDGYVYYKYWTFNDPDFKEKYNGKMFRMTKENFTVATRRLYRQYKGVDVGAYTIPFRLRKGGDKSFDFETALSLQANVVFGFGSRKKEYSWLDASWGIGLTKINLDSENSTVTEPRSASALTTSVGVIFKPAQHVNLGVFSGWDFLGKRDRKTEWIYNKKTWIGIGINIAFDVIKTDKSITTSTENKSPKQSD